VCGVGTGSAMVIPGRDRLKPTVPQPLRLRCSSARFPPQILPTAAAFRRLLAGERLCESRAAGGASGNRNARNERSGTTFRRELRWRNCRAPSSATNPVDQTSPPSDLVDSGETAKAADPCSTAGGTCETENAEPRRRKRVCTSAARRRQRRSGIPPPGQSSTGSHSTLSHRATPPAVGPMAGQLETGWWHG